MGSVPHLDISIPPENIPTDFLQVLDIIRPKWDQSKLKFEKSKLEMSRGLLNTMVTCSNKDYPAESIMIRIHNASVTNLKLMVRSTEVTCVKELSKLNCAPNILATFLNGFCYDYIVGEILNHFRLREDPIWKLIAEDIAKMNSVTILDGEELNGKNKMSFFMDMMIAGFPDKLEDAELDRRMRTELPSKEVLVKEIAIAKAETLKVNSPMVLCHNDTRAENIIWQPHLGVIRFVDFEGMNYNYQAAELANHFSRYAGFMPPDMSLIPSTDFQMRWLNVYLRKYYKCLGFDPDSVTLLDVRKLFVQVNKYYMFVLIAAGIAGPVMAAKSLFDIQAEELDFMTFSAVFVNEYFKRKEEFLALEMPD